MPKITDLRLRRGTAAAWAASNPILGVGEPGLETDTGKLKFGNGTAAWNALPYGIPGGTGLQTVDQSGAWDTWRKALANMGTKTAKMLHLGDSITEGTGVTTRQQTWPYLVAKKIREAYPSIPGNTVTTSTGWSPVRQTSSTLPSTWTIAGTYTDNLFGFRFTRSIALQPGGTVTGTVTGTSIDIWFPKGTATGNFTVKVDGVQVGGTYGGTAASTTDGFVQRISLGAAGSHTVVLTSTHATNPQYFSGITVFNGNENSGVVSINAGFHGSNTANWVTAANNANWVQNIPALDPDLITIALGANDYSAALGYTGFKDNLRTLVEKIRANSITYPSICFIAVGKRSENVTPKWEAYEFALQQLAAELGCGFIDVRRVLADAGSAEAVSAGLYADTVHPTAAGYSIMADEIARVLLDPTYGVLMPPPDPAPVGHVHSLVNSSTNGFMSAADKVILDAAASGLVPSTLVERDANSNFSAGTPTADAHVATKGYVDSGVIRGSAGAQYRKVGCVIRFDPGTGKFEFISDAGHVPVGCSSVQTFSDRIVLNYSFTGTKVISSSVTPDEKLAQKGFTMGPSVGTSSMTIYLGQGGFCDYVTATGASFTSLNGFVTAMSRSTTTWTFTHDYVDGPIGGQASYRGGAYQAIAEGMGNTTTAVSLWSATTAAQVNPSIQTVAYSFWIMRGGTRRVNPLTDLNIANSNIWIEALLEV